MRPNPRNPWCRALAGLRSDHAAIREFALSVSDDTIYRAMKELGFSHVSARPKAYKQDAEAMEAFKKTFPHASPKSARGSHRAHRSKCGSKTRCGLANLLFYA